MNCTSLSTWIVGLDIVGEITCSGRCTFVVVGWENFKTPSVFSLLNSSGVITTVFCTGAKRYNNDQIKTSNMYEQYHFNLTCMNSTILIFISTHAESNLFIKVIEVNLQLCPLWAIALYIQVKIIYTIY